MKGNLQGWSGGRADIASEPLLPRDPPIPWDAQRAALSHQMAPGLLETMGHMLS